LQRPLKQAFIYGYTINDDVLRGLGTISGRLLDVGSGEGRWADRLREAGARELVALDPSSAAIEIASERYDRAVVGTIEGATLAHLGGEPFDVIVAADVLEHLVDPWRAMRILRSWATPRAILAVSVPNLRFYRLVGNLVLRGEFEYERCGVRDWTHLRWFTRLSLGRALAASGWEPEHWVTSATRKGALLAKISEQLANDFLRQQLIVVARAAAARPAPEPADSARPAFPSVLRAQPRSPARSERAARGDGARPRPASGLA
jgi:2-polyprenyl-3-methyl-5-hydroxy-6-metoxy-1,4-benzoquinol methylase